MKCKLEANVLKEKRIIDRVRQVEYELEKTKQEYYKEKNKNEKIKLLEKAVKNKQLNNIYGRLGPKLI